MKNSLLTTLLFLISLFLFNTIKAQNAYDVLSIEVIVTIKEDGSFHVEENSLVNFNKERRGIFRAIPLRYKVGDQTRKISIKDFRENNGHEYKVYTENGNRVIRIGNPKKYITGEVNYAVEYTVQNAITSYEEHDEFYWNLVDYESEAMRKKAQFSIVYPVTWQDSITEYEVFSGPVGSQAHDIEINHERNVIAGTSLKELAKDHGITIAIKFPKGLFRSSITKAGASTDSQTKNKKPLDWIVQWWNVIPVALAALLLGLYRKFEKTETIADSNDAIHYPPEGMSPAETGAFVDYVVNRRDLISLLPYWGNKGFISIKPLEGSDSDLYFMKKTDPENLSPAEEILFNGLFRDGDVVLLSDLTNQFHGTMNKTSDRLKKDIIEKDLYDQDSLKYLHSGWLLLFGVLGILSGIALIAVFQALAAGVGMIILGAFTFYFHFKRPKLSSKGMRNHNHLKNLREFLKNPDEDEMHKILSEDSQYLNKIYPYVLAFGIDETWSKALKSFDVKYPPIWYDSTATGIPFTYHTSSKHFNARSIEKVFYSTPAPSNTGGGFSGGSAGGGFGGGSSGSW